MMTINQTAPWKKLQAQAQIKRQTDAIEKELTSTESAFLNTQKNIEACGLTLDFSHQNIHSHIFTELLNLTTTAHLKDHITQLFSGGIVNLSQNKPALHTALRAPASHTIQVNHENIMQLVTETRSRISHLAEKIRSHAWRGHNGQAITDIVNIGIGGSDLGPKFCLKALSEFTANEFNYHFISDADPFALETTLARLNPDTVLFIVSSKSFTTQETMLNAQLAIAWMGHRPLEQHFIAVTANHEAARQYGIQTILPIWSWIGGRYSVCSAINLITAIAIGADHFNAFLNGAYAMDQHFATTPFHRNLPVLLALIGIWNSNFLDINNLLMLTYSNRLSYFTNYVQQLDMESNGKSIDNEGRPTDYSTGPIVWGGCGNQAQHSYYQLLCQGTQAVTIDFITMNTPENRILNGFCKAKMQALSEGISNQTTPRDIVRGQIPFNHLSLTACTPEVIGALLALYEHKIFTQSVIWNINPFDQPGVDSSKSIQRACTATPEQNITYA